MDTGLKWYHYAGIVVVSLGVAFLLGWYGWGLKYIFYPIEQQIEREVFEETKSYVHGKIQDLAKYYEECQKATDDDKATIADVIQMQFANFEADKIDNFKLRSFLVEIRGF